MRSRPRSSNRVMSSPISAMPRIGLVESWSSSHAGSRSARRGYGPGHCHTPGVSGVITSTRMDETNQWLASRFEEHRAHLRSVAYRMLGSLSEADDAVQDAWLRVSRAGANDVENLAGWLTTIVARVSLNMLRSRSSRREVSLGPYIPEPIIDRADATNPEHQAVLADSVGLAL